MKSAIQNLKSKIPVSVFVCVCLWLILSSSAFAGTQKTWVVSLYNYDSSTGVTRYNSGVTPSISGVSGPTTAKNQTTSGVSLMAITEGEKAIKGDNHTMDISDSDGYLIVNVIDLAPSYGPTTAASGTTDYSSGTTFAFYVKKVFTPGRLPTPDDWAKAEWIPVILNMPLNSSTTPWAVAVSVEPGTYLRPYLCASGMTAFGKAQIGITKGLNGQAFPAPQPLVIEEGTFTIVANGVSTWATGSIGAFPNGGRYVEYMLISGATIYVTANGSTPTTSGNGEAVPMGATPRTLSGAEASSAKFKATATATSVWYRILNRKR